MLPEEDGLARLDEVVELVGGPAGELVDHLAAARPRRRHGFQSSAQVIAYIRSISAWSVSRIPGALDLDRDGLAAVEDRPMDLAHRGGGERDGLERAEDRLDVGAQLLPDDPFHFAVGEGRDLVAELYSSSQ